MTRVAVGLLCLAAIAAAPMTPLPPAQSAQPMLRSDPAVVGRFVEVLRDTIELGAMPDGTAMRRETVEERKISILPRNLARQFFDYGIVSGGIEACGGDWQQMGFAPFRARIATLGLTPKQQGFAIRLHEAAREQGNDIPEEECSPELKAALAATLKAHLAAL